MMVIDMLLYTVYYDDASPAPEALELAAALVEPIAAATCSLWVFLLSSEPSISDIKLDIPPEPTSM